MNIVNLERRALDFRAYVKRSALTSDYTRLIREDTLVLENGEPSILYARLPLNLTIAVRNACQTIRYDTSTRLKGLKTTSRIFGYNPRNVIRKDFCSATSMATEHPAEHQVICEFGQHLAALYAKHFPEKYGVHDAIVNEKVLPGWRLQNTPFTSGIVNKNNPLKYHFDSGNIAEVLSNMVVFKHGVAGGHLACPEFDIGFEASDNSVVLFDGQNILHGVTPIQRLTADAYRYSIVYYTLQRMWSCLPLDEELARARSVRVARERKRAAGVDPNTLTWS
jgi:hypothetical protein